MKITVDQDFSAPLDRLWRVFSDPSYPRSKYIALGATQFEQTRFSASDTLIEVDLSRQIPVNLEKIPSFARKLIGAEQTMRHSTRWHRVKTNEVRAELTITAVGRPVQIGGTALLTARDDQSSRLTFDLEIKSELPLIGGKIEKLFADQITAALAADYTYTREYFERA